MENTVSLIRRIHNLLQSKQISCREITEKYLNAISESKLNAYVKVCEDVALKTADTVDKKIANGDSLSLLEGIPMTLKDNISTDGIETTCCSNILKGYSPIYDASVWSTLKKQNCVLLGKTNMDEFAMGSSCKTSCYGGAKNPHNFDHVPGGSSGGVAAAVCGNIAVFGLGSDTGGSIRQPASFCGIVGLKPTYGAVSRYGLIAYGSSLDQIGPIVKTAEDASIVYDAISGFDSKDSTSSKQSVSDTFSHLNDSIKNTKIGIIKQYFEGINQDIKKSIDSAIEIFKSMGAEIVYLDFPELKYSLPVYYILACAEASSNLGRYDGIRYGYRTKSYSDINEMICKTRSEGFGSEVKRRILLGTYVLSAGYYDAYYKKAQKLRKVIDYKFQQLFKNVDIMISPTAPTTAFELNSKSVDPVSEYLQDICTVPINIAGLPAISIPCGFDDKNLPIGMQIIGNKFSENRILNAAHQYQLYTNYSALHDVDMGVKI